MHKLFIGAIFASNFKQSKLLAGGVLSGKTVSFGKESWDGNWRSGMVFTRLAFIVHSVSMISEVTNSGTSEEVLMKWM